MKAYRECSIRHCFEARQPRGIALPIGHHRKIQMRRLRDIE